MKLFAKKIPFVMEHKFSILVETSPFRHLTSIILKYSVTTMQTKHIALATLLGNGPGRSFCATSLKQQSFQCSTRSQPAAQRLAAAERKGEISTFFLLAHSSPHSGSISRFTLPSSFFASFIDNTIKSLSLSCRPA
jgi:hypothetical protein